MWADYKTDYTSPSVGERIPFKETNKRRSIVYTNTMCSNRHKNNLSITLKNIKFYWNYSLDSIYSDISTVDDADWSGTLKKVWPSVLMQEIQCLIYWVIQNDKYNRLTILK